MNTIRLSFSIFAAALLAACASPRVAAPITERTAAPEMVRAPEVKAPPVVKAPAREAERGMYTVKRGDTLIHIALEFGQNYRDLITWNNLANPNDIKVDQVLRVLPPEGGVQTFAVAPQNAPEPRPAAAKADAAPLGSAPVKTAPRGEKRPYSEAALADLQKPDNTAAPAAAVGPAVAAAVAPRVESALKVPAEKPVETPAAPAAPAADDEAVSWMWPTDGKVSSAFDDVKKGIDIGGTAGQPVFAAAAGKILYANSIRGYGNLVIVKHTNNLLSAYAHNKTILVKENQTVTKGQKIAEMGNTDSDAVKLHFEIRQQGKPVDPTKFLPGR